MAEEKDSASYLCTISWSTGSIWKKEAAQVFGVSERSIQRDRTALNFLRSRLRRWRSTMIRSELRPAVEGEGALLSCGEMLAVCKILLEAGRYQSGELDQILDKLLAPGIRPPEWKSSRRFFPTSAIVMWSPPRKTAGRHFMDPGADHSDPFRDRGGLSNSDRREEAPPAPTSGPDVPEFYFYLAAFLKTWTEIRI